MPGRKKILWLSGGEFAGDDTDGHIDQLARFIAPSKIVVAAPADDADENTPMLRKLREELDDLVDLAGRPFEIFELPLPSAKYYNNQRLPTSYCNFYMLNEGVIVPQFDDPADERAIGILTDLFPMRQVIGLPALDMVWGLGAFHCLSQQEPIG